MNYLIQHVAEDLNTQCATKALGLLDDEQIEALGDASQAFDFLDDLEARCGLDVAAARIYLTVYFS